MNVERSRNFRLADPTRERTESFCHTSTTTPKMGPTAKPMRLYFPVPPISVAQAMDKYPPTTYMTSRNARIMSFNGTVGHVPDLPRRRRRRTLQVREHPHG